MPRRTPRTASGAPRATAIASSTSIRSRCRRWSISPTGIGTGGARGHRAAAGRLRRDPGRSDRPRLPEGEPRRHDRDLGRPCDRVAAAGGLQPADGSAVLRARVAVLVHRTRAQGTRTVHDRRGAARRRRADLAQPLRSSGRRKRRRARAPGGRLAALHRAARRRPLDARSRHRSRGGPRLVADTGCRSRGPAPSDHVRAQSALELSHADRSLRDAVGRLCRRAARRRIGVRVIGRLPLLLRGRYRLCAAVPHADPCALRSFRFRGDSDRRLRAEPLPACAARRAGRSGSHPSGPRGPAVARHPLGNVRADERAVRPAAEGSREGTRGRAPAARRVRRLPPWRDTHPRSVRSRKAARRRTPCGQGRCEHHP